jgi:hypothetical protein
MILHQNIGVNRAAMLFCVDVQELQIALPVTIV